MLSTFVSCLPLRIHSSPSHVTFLYLFLICTFGVCFLTQARFFFFSHLLPSFPSFYCLVLFFYTQAQSIKYMSGSY
jgi:hypothetical protein